MLLESLQDQTDKLTNGFQHETSSPSVTKKGMKKTESNGSVHAAPTNGHVGLSNGHSGPANGNAELTNGHADHENGTKAPQLSHQVCSASHDMDFSLIIKFNTQYGLHMNAPIHKALTPKGAGVREMRTALPNP